MRIFLIRHGETVDNVANLYAGVRDSALTVHGSLQIQRLAQFLTESGLRFTHVFSSDLERAYKTANAICLAQFDRYGDENDTKVRVAKLPILREQDFGIYEGKPFSARHDNSQDSVIGEKGTQLLRQDQDHKEVESKESMGRRARVFLNEHLVPIIKQTIDEDISNVAVVSHGIFLNYLWRGFLRLLPVNSVALSPTLAVGGGNATSLEYIGGWSNTGYLELHLRRAEDASVDRHSPDSVGPPSLSTDSTPLHTNNATMQNETLSDIKLTVTTLNGRDHLAGLKRTRGGVGSSKQEEGQTTIEAFFKKRKL